MSAFTDARGQLDALEADIVSIRRQIEDGGAVDLIGMPARVETMCAAIEGLPGPDAKSLTTDLARLVGLIDAVTKDVTGQYTRIKSAYERLQQQTAAPAKPGSK